MAEEKKKTTTVKNPFYKNIWFWVVVIVFVVWVGKATLFLLLFLFSIVALVIGLTNPDVFKKIIKKPTRKKVGLYCGSAVVLFLILFTVYSPLSQSPAKKEEKAQTTEVVKKKEEAKTETPKPTETPSKQLSSEEKKYTEEMGQQTIVTGEAIGKIGSFLGSNSDMRFWTDNEKISLAIGMALVQNNYTQAEKMSPPDKFKEIHSKYLEASKKYYDSMTSLAQGIDDIDPDKITKAMNLMEEGTKLLEETTSMIKKLTP